MKIATTLKHFNWVMAVILLVFCIALIVTAHMVAAGFVFLCGIIFFLFYVIESKNEDIEALQQQWLKGEDLWWKSNVPVKAGDPSFPNGAILMSSVNQNTYAKQKSSHPTGRQEGTQPYSGKQ